MTTKQDLKKQRKRDRAKLRRQARLRDVAIAELHKPLEEWDDEELARGRPRAMDGSFRGKSPDWINRQVHEEALRRFKDLSQGQLRAIVPEALQQLHTI